MNTYDKIKNGLNEVKEMPYENGMATEKKVIETELGTIEIMRKCADHERPEIFLLFLKPNLKVGHKEPNTKAISKKIMHILGLDNTDLNLKPKGRYKHENEYTCIFPVSLL